MHYNSSVLARHASCDFSRAYLMSQELPKAGQPTRQLSMFDTACIIVGIIIAIFIVIFVGRNLWHGDELEQDQAVGNNVATEHTGPSYNQRL